MKLKPGIVVNDLSDHLPVFTLAEYVTSPVVSKKSVYKTVRKMKETNLNQFSQLLNDVKWDDNILNSDDVNISFKYFLEKYTELFNTACPLVKIKQRISNVNKPSMTPGLLTACKKKNSLYKAFLKYRTGSSETKYKTYKNKLTSIMRKAERAFYCNKLNEYKSNIKETWKILNDITRRGKKYNQNKISSEFKIDNTLICDKKQISEEFNKFFVNIGPSLAQKIPTCNAHYSDFLSNKVTNSLYLNPICNEEIISLVSKFHSKKSSGFDNISMQLIKKTISSIVKPLTNIFNKSFETGVFPDDMKKAKVVPIFKGGDKTNLSNYRPISMLPQFSKLLEKLYNNRLMSFLKYKDILYNGQYGFRENHSTSLALMELVEEITSNIDKRLCTTGVFIDLRKAFDTIDHSILIHKLNHYGIRGLASHWLTSYLSSRKQYVCIENDVCSNDKTILCGVPQGSILGPILFLLYINDLPNISDKLKFILFADDTNIFYTDKNISIVHKVLNVELEKLNLWFKVNKLSLNIDKTNFMVFSNSNIDNCESIKINGIIINRVYVTKFLGVLIDSKLSWEDQIGFVCQKVRKGIGVLNRVKTIIDSQSLYTLYCSLILLDLSYAS